MVDRGLGRHWAVAGVVDELRSIEAEDDEEEEEDKDEGIFIGEADGLLLPRSRVDKAPIVDVNDSMEHIPLAIRFPLSEDDGEDEEYEDKLSSFSFWVESVRFKWILKKWKGKENKKKKLLFLCAPSFQY